MAVCGVLPAAAIVLVLSAEAYIPALYVEGPLLYKRRKQKEKLDSKQDTPCFTSS